MNRGSRFLVIIAWVSILQYIIWGRVLRTRCRRWRRPALRKIGWRYPPYWEQEFKTLPHSASVLQRLYKNRIWTRLMERLDKSSFRKLLPASGNFINVIKHSPQKSIQFRDSDFYPQILWIILWRKGHKLVNNLFRFEWIC